jgi:hydroxymethylpyrimidine/phosphomethylpyrimidine kinase
VSSPPRRLRAVPDTPARSDAATPPVALTIAGSDSGGGAGIQADLRAFGEQGAFGTSVLTAVTAQNTRGVDAVHVLPSDVVTAQLDSVLGDLPPVAVKTGMLATAELTTLVAERAEAGELPSLVVDPVLVSATGHRLLDDDALAVYRERLFACATVATPNIPEAAALLGREVHELGDLGDVARELAATGARAVVVKGGHRDGPRSTDVLLLGDDIHELEADRIVTRNTHGTGCTFAAATAGALATGLDIEAALLRAKSYVTACIAGAVAWQLGGGTGPLDHLGFTPRS